MSPTRVCALLILGVHVIAATIPKPPSLRLGPGVSPQRYKASILIIPGAPTFTADLAIELRIDKSSDQIWINAEELAVDSAILSAGTKKLKPQIVTTAKEFIGFLLDQPLQPGSATLQLHYTGKISDKPGRGISHSSRKGSDYVVTDFEPIAARRVFPCFDEPNFKVPWQLTIDAPAKDMVISNAAVESDTPMGDRHRVIFRETKPLPSYLVAFTIGEYEAIELGKVGRNQVPVRVIVPSGDRVKASFAAKTVPKIIEKLENYFNIGYPYEKLDQVAVPNYPEGSAMEDAGSILYNDSLILCAPETLTHATEQQILSVLIHETAHQWFGDLVTLAWWNDTWLNEGMTEWLEWKIERQWGPEWRDDLAAMSDLARVVRQDVGPVSHPIRQKIDTRSEIETELDDITYFKTAQVLQMIEHYVGEESLRNAIRNYMRAHLFRNATSQDFLKELGTVNSEAVICFEQFLNRTGLPQITVALDCSSTEPVVHVRQETYRPVGVDGGTGEPWTFPMCIEYSSDKTTKNICILAKTPAFDMHLPGGKCPTWLIANQEASGYYISRYDGPAFEKLSSNLQALSLLDRLHMVWETSFLVSSGREKPSYLLHTMRMFGTFSTLPNLLAVLRGSHPLLRYETSPEASKRLTEYYERTFGETGRKLGWVPPPHASDKERENHLDAVSSIAILGEDQELIQSARNLASDWLRDRKSVPADVAGPALLVAGRFATEEFYNQLLHAAVEENDHENRMKALTGLAAARDPRLIQKNFGLFTAAKFPILDSVRLLMGPAWFPFHALPEVRRMPLEFIREHTKQVRSLFPEPLGRDYSSALAYSASPLCSEGDGKLAEATLAPILDPEDGGKQRLAEAIESIKLCTAAREATESDFEIALEMKRNRARKELQNH